jgi:hypothetical protein
VSVALRGRGYGGWWILHCPPPVTRRAEAAEIRGSQRKSSAENDLQQWAGDGAVLRERVRGS